MLGLLPAERGLEFASSADTDQAAAPLMVSKDRE